VIPRFVRAAIEGRPPLVYGTGQQVRAFCFVDDIVEGLTLTLFSPDANGEVFNLGNDSGFISILDLGHKIVALSKNRGPAPQLVPYEKADRTSERDVIWRVPQIQKAKQVLSYAPKVGLDDGIFRFFNSMKTLSNY
jgi:nucleoside-diphosphate-sugar epimerase